MEINDLSCDAATTPPQNATPSSIVSVDNIAHAQTQYPLLADYTDLKDVALRRLLETERGLYMAESGQVIRRALRAGHTPRSVVMAPKWLSSHKDIVDVADQVGAPVYVAAEDELQQLVGFHLHRGVLASMHRPQLPSMSSLLEKASRVVVLEDITDHTNVGAIFRACAGFGFDAVLVTPRCADPLYRRSIRVSMGTVFQVPWTRLESWPGGVQMLRDAGFETAALALADDAVPLDVFAAQAPSKVALLFGTEGDGLTGAALRNADHVVTIPMAAEVDSLNVAAAAAVTCYALRPAVR